MTAMTAMMVTTKDDSARGSAACQNQISYFLARNAKL